MSETDLMRRLQIAASRLGARLFRQNTGMAWTGKIEKGWPGRRVVMRHGDVLLRNARPFHAGFKGMSDLGGWTPVTITSDMVGETVAVYAQCEVKENAKPTKKQIAWIKAVNAAGGRAGIVRCEADLIRILFE